MNTFVNIAAYKFVSLDNLEKRSEEVKALTESFAIKGTVLLSHEGINLFVAGGRQSIDELISYLRGDPHLEDLEIKESLSDHQPFNRMLVKIKKEIIAFGIDGIDPRQYTSPRISAQQLKQWLDEGKPVTLLDTRNTFEYEVGTFENAIPAGVDDFRSFPDAVRKLPSELKRQPVVTFCTGGIRCEKAAPLMERAGFQEVYQLDGGILKYFEECGDAHYRGECFVFDKRVALDSRLMETETSQCYACQAPLSPEERRSPMFEVGESCPHCYVSPEQRLEHTLLQRHEAIQKYMSPLAGSVPYEHRRPLHVAAKFDNFNLLDFLCAVHVHVSREQWRDIIAHGEIHYKESPIDESFIVRAGQRVERVRPATIEPDVNANIRILHEDDAVVAVDKPAPLPMHPCGRFNRNSLTWILREVYAPICLRLAHRLDANTSGVVLFSKSKKFAAYLQPQFERGEVSKRYVARVVGQPEWDEFVSTTPIGDTKSKTGTCLPDPDGAPARTEFSVIQKCDDGTTLIEARPVTGRTNQIRIHLWDTGLPIVGDPLFLPDKQIGNSQTLDPAEKPLCLHARQVTVRHPATEEIVSFESPLPNWAEAW